MVERDEIEAAAAVVERTEIDKTLTLVIEPQAIYVSATEAAHISTPMPKLASATTSQEILATQPLQKLCYYWLLVLNLTEQQLKMDLNLQSHQLDILRSYLLKSYPQ